MPSKPGNPSEGKAAEPEQLEAEAAEAKAAASTEAAAEKAEATEEAPQQVKKTRAKKAAPKAEEDRAHAAEGRGSAKPARKPRAKKADKPAEVEAEAAEEAPAEEKPKPARKPAEETAKPAGKPGRRGRREAPGRVVVRAHAKYVRTSARKARLVCDHLRGKDVGEARAILLHTNRQVAEAWTKLLESAVANAAENHSLDGEDLRIAFVSADEGPTLKRFRPRAMGRATKIRKRTSHLSIGLEPKE
jgi:ribosomal protein L22